MPASRAEIEKAVPVLLLRKHPDKDSSAGSTARTQAVLAAATSNPPAPPAPFTTTIPQPPTALSFAPRCRYLSTSRPRSFFRHWGFLSDNVARIFHLSMQMSQMSRHFNYFLEAMSFSDVATSTPRATLVTVATYSTLEIRPMVLTPQCAQSVLVYKFGIRGTGEPAERPPAGHPGAFARCSEIWGSFRSG